jgi:uncharacterized protein (DUF302 family)
MRVREVPMLYPSRILFLLSVIGIASMSTAVRSPSAENDGIVRVASAVPIEEAASRVRRAVAEKGIQFFSEIDQAELAAKAGIKLRPSILLVFGNPPLGTQFITANPNAGLDWPVRLLLTQDESGHVWAAYSDFGWIARRHRISNRDDQFKMATAVVQSITATLAGK